MEFIRRLLTQYRFAAIGLVTVLTLAIVGAVILTTTSAGCAPANKLGLKTARCVNQGPVARVGVTTPTPTQSAPVIVPTAPPLPPPPTDSGVSAVPPSNAGVTPNQPGPGPLSAGAPPLAWSDSSSVPPSGPLSCRLPVYAGGPASGGFLVLPGRTFVADPRSAVLVPSPRPGVPSPTPPQYGQGLPPGFYGLTYDAAYSKWLAVPYTWVSPDGAHYAYPLGGDIYAQNVATGTELDLAQGQGYQPLRVANDGVYVTQPNHAGLWFVPFSGATRQVTPTGFWQAIGGGAAYGTPTAQVPPGATAVIDKLDLNTGAMAPFWSSDSGPSYVMGFDFQGNPVIQVGYPTGSAIFIVGPQSYYAIAAESWGPYVRNAPWPGGQPIADRHGLWFSVGSGIVLYADGAWYWMASIGGQVAGQCL